MMNFSVDTVSIIGAAHVRSGMMNQDYAYGEVDGDHHGLITVSDGCSTGDKTDVGARVQSLAAVQSLATYANAEIFSHDAVVRDIQEIMDETAVLLNLTDDDLLATNLYGIATKDAAHIVVRGDGVVAIGFTSGSWRFIRIEWRGNMPFYPIYTSSDRIEQFVSAQGGEDTLSVTLEYVDVAEDGSVCSWCERRSVAEGVHGLAFSFADVAYKEVSAIGVFSDGVAEIASPGQRTPWTDVMQQVTSFKNTSGVFLVRRMMRVLRDYGKQDAHPQDDISGAMLLIDHESDEEAHDESE